LTGSKVGWLDKLYIYAALAGTETIAEAQTLLGEANVSVTHRQLEVYKRCSAERIQQVAERHLPQRLFGLFAFDICDRLDSLARRIEDKLYHSDWQEKVEMDLMDKYLKLMQLLANIRPGEQDSEQPCEAASNDESAIEEIFKRLEQTNDRQEVRDTLRRVAAATGSGFPRPQPD